MKNIVIVAHKYLQQPDDDYILYLNDSKFGSVYHITHSFPDAKDRKSRLSIYRNGILTYSRESFDYIKFPEVIVYLKEIILTIKWVLGSKDRFDLYIGMDGFCSFIGLLLKFFGKIDRVIFWAMDFVPKNRFNGLLGVTKSFFYNGVNKFSYLRSDEVWDISPRMKEAREKFLGVPQNSYKSQRIVPFGVWNNRIRTYTYGDCDKQTIVFMGHLLEKQGVQLIIKALPILEKTYPNIRFKIIGDGQYKDRLIKLALDLEVLQKCDFLGHIPDHKILENEIAKCVVAVAPYIKELDSWTYYADPGKIKVYLACGVPVATTALPWNTNEIQENQCGKIISEDPQSVIEGVRYLMDASQNQVFRNNALEYSKTFDYDNIFRLVLENLKDSVHPSKSTI